MKIRLFLLTFLSLYVNLMCAQATLHFARTEVIPVTDHATGRSYELYLRLPEDYPKEDRAYPVIYYTDALWHVEMLSGTTEYLMEDAILVGISWEKNLKGALGALGPHGSRFRDYSSRASDDAEHQAKYHFGQAATHLDFIRTTVIPYVDKNYRTDTHLRAYFGYSLGGEFGAHILLTQPDTFTHYILGSPTVRQEIPHFRALAEQSPKRDNARVFLSHGSLENELAPAIKAFIDLLQEDKENGFRLTSEVVEGSHQTAFPLTVVRAVRWLVANRKED